MGRISSSIESNEDNRITESLLATDNHISPSSNENQINKIKQISSKYDVCFIFPVNTDIKSNKLFQKEGEEIVRILIQAVGEEDILMYKSARRKLTDNEIITDEDEHKIIVLIRLSNERAVCLSYIKGHKLLANHHELKARAIEGWKANEEKNQPKVHPLVLDMDDDRKDITQYGPFQHIYLKYSHEPEYQTLYYDYHHTSNTVAFSKISKLKLLKDLLDDNYDEVDDGINIDLDKVVLPQSNGNPSIVSAIFPLHDDSALQSLKLSCRFINFDAQSDSRTSKLELKFKHFFPWWLDYTAIKNYFGEKIALYYVFTGHFSKWLAYPAIVGLTFEAYILLTSQNDQVGNPIVPVYSVFIVVWGVCMLEYWQQKEQDTALQWGTLGYEEEESIRSEFKDFEKVKLIGKQTLYFSAKKKNWLLFKSFTRIFVFCSVVIGTVAGIYIIRAQLSSTSETAAGYASIVSSVMNAVQVQVYAYLYTSVSEQLTDSENHRTDSEYEDSMIAKSFIFSFINSYASFIFIAYFAAIVPKPTYPGQVPDDNVGMCGYPNCMTALAINLGIVLVANTISSIVFVANDYFAYKTREKEQSEKYDILTPAEKQFLLDKYTFKDLIKDYMQIAILFGYMNLFVAALPGIAFLSFLSLWLEIKADAWRLTTINRRSWPDSAEDFGTFKDVFSLMNSAAVITNGSLIAFTMPILQGFSQTVRFWAFIGFVWVISAIQYFIRQIVADIPEDVRIQKERKLFYERKLIKRIRDEDVTQMTQEDPLVTKDWLFETCRQKCV